MSHSLSPAGRRVCGRAASFFWGSILCGGLLCWQASAQQVIATASTGASGDPFNAPQYVVYDKSENLFVSDSGSSRVRRIDAQSGAVTTVAGTGVFGFSGMGGAATQAQLGCPAQMVFDSAGNLFVSDACDHVVWKVTAGQGGLMVVALLPSLCMIVLACGDWIDNARRLVIARFGQVAVAPMLARRGDTAIPVIATALILLLSAMLIRWLP